MAGHRASEENPLPPFSTAIILPPSYRRLVTLRGRNSRLPGGRYCLRLRLPCQAFELEGSTPSHRRERTLLPAKGSRMRPDLAGFRAEGTNHSKEAKR